MYEAVSSWLAELSLSTGLVLVLDDLHWAGTPTVQLLAHVLRTLTANDSARLLILATYRNTDVEPTDPLPALLGELYRVPGVEPMKVENLSKEDVLRLIEASLEQRLDDQGGCLAARVFEETRGNPFFVKEILRHLAETGSLEMEGGRWVVVRGDLGDVPDRLKDVVSKRLGRLSETASTLMHTAAVLGRDVDFQVLSRVVDEGESKLLDALDEALRSGLLEETSAGQLRFTHGLVQASLYDNLSAARRRRTHHLALEVLEDLQPERAGALARHALEVASGEITPDRRISYCIAAGEHALTRRAPGDADRWFGQAIRSASEQPPSDELLILQARCGQGEARRALGDAEAGAILLAVAKRALEVAELELAVRAVSANTRFLPSLTRTSTGRSSRSSRVWWPACRAGAQRVRRSSLSWPPS